MEIEGHHRHISLLEPEESTELFVSINLHPDDCKTISFEDGITRVHINDASLKFDKIVIPATVEYIDPEIIKNAGCVEVDENNMFLESDGTPKMNIGISLLDDILKEDIDLPSGDLYSFGINDFEK
jgi:hypothetical protein